MKATPMAMTRLIRGGAAVAGVMSSVLAGCSSVEREPKLAATQTAAPTDGQAAGSSETAPTGPSVTLAKTSRLSVPVPAAVETTSVQIAAMAAPGMPPFVAFAPVPSTTASFEAATVPMSSAAQAPAAPSPLPATSTILAAAKGGRHSTPVAAGGGIQPAAASAIAPDEAELTPDMVALQSVIPTPRPPLPPTGPRTDTATLAYASQPKPVSFSTMEFPPAPGDPLPATASNAPPELSKLIQRYAGMYGVPESLVHRVVHRESKYDPKAYHKNGYWGLMQIKYSTAKSMGYSGPPEGLLDAETNLKYAIKYLRGAWLVADNQNDNAIRLYARGYYYDAKRKDMLHVLEK